MNRVVLIDDEEDALDLLEILLEQIGPVEVVGRYVNPLQALTVLESSDLDSVDAVFLDIHMPGMRGMEAARRIRQLRPGIPIVFTTAYAEYAVEAFEIQSIDYLLKPFTPVRLQQTLARIQALSAPTPSVGLAGRPSSFPYIHFFEEFRIQLSDDATSLLPWKTTKEKELCAFLLHQRGASVNTALIIEALWPEHDLSKAKTYLYTCLSYLRKTLAEHQVPIKIERVDKAFVVKQDRIASDVAEMEEAIQQVLTEEQLNLHGYERMKRLYRGPYLATNDFRWAEAKRMDLHAACVHALRCFQTYFYNRGEMTLAVDSMEWLLRVAPDSEADGRRLIETYLAMGNRNEARRVYQRLEQTIRMELGARLETATLRLYRQVQPS